MIVQRKKITVLIKNHIVLIGCIILYLSGRIPAEVLVKPGNDGINYYGRFAMSDDGLSVDFNWPGSIIEAKFTGTTIGVELDDGGGSYFNVELDGTVIDTLSPSSATRRMIADDIDENTPHTIRIILRTNGKNCTFGGFYLADGHQLSDKPEKPMRKIEFIGDSWTAGDVVGTSSTNDLKYFNAALTYARLTSIAFHSQDMLIARGGCGLVNGYGAVMQERYPQTLCDASGAWDFSSWTPDIVVMFLGINDFNKGTADNTFIAAYQRLITTVRDNYTNLPVVLVGLNETIQGHHHLNIVKKVAEDFSDVTVFSSPIRLNNAKALWQHPTPAQHKEISDSLIPVIMEITGWDTVPPVTTGASPLETVRQRHHFNRSHTLIKTTAGTVAFPDEFTGTVKKVSVYDCSGRMRYRTTTSERKLFLRKDAGLPEGMFIISIDREIF